MKILVEIKNVYGRELVYPICNKANLFCQMLRRQTLTRDDIEYIKALGYTIEVKTRVL